MEGRRVDEWDLHQFFERMRREEQRARFCRPGPDPRHELGREVELQVRAHLEGLGYWVSKAAPNARHDLWCEGVRVEVKGARWTGRYQANLRRNQADVLVLGCVNGSIGFFVIPSRC